MPESLNPKVQEALDELKTKFGSISTLEDVVKSFGARIENLESIEVEDFRTTAKDAQQMKVAVEKLEASLEKLPETIREEYKGMLDLAPDTKVQAGTPANNWVDLRKMGEKDFELQGAAIEHLSGVGSEAKIERMSFLSPWEKQKAAATLANINPQGAATTAAGNIQGGILDPTRVWTEAQPGDAWVQAGAVQMPLDNPMFKTAELDSISFSDTAKPSATSLDNNQGTLEESVHVAKTHTCRFFVSIEQQMDVQGLSELISRYVMMQYGKERGDKTSGAVRTASDGTNVVKTGHASQGLSDSNAYDKLTDLTVVGNVVNYWPYGASFVLSPVTYIKLLQNQVELQGFAMTPGMMPGFPLWGVNVDAQASQVAANAITDFFGAWGACLIQAQQGRLNLDRYTETIPGAITYFARFRFLPVVYDKEAFGYIKVAA